MFPAPASRLLAYRVWRTAALVAAVSLLFAACGEAELDGFDGRPLSNQVVSSGGQVPQGADDNEFADSIEPDPANPLHVFVGPEGDDSFDGQTPETPWRTLVAAINNSQPGMVVWVMDGVYTGSMAGQAHYYITTSGTADAWIRYRAMPGHQPVVRGSTTSAFEVEANYIEIHGFEIEGVGFTTENFYGYGVVAVRAHHVTVSSNEIHGFPSSGFGSGGSSHLSVIGNTVYENALWDSDQGSGISMWRLEDHGFGDDGDGYSNYIVGNVTYANENRVFCGFCAEEMGEDDLLTDGNGIIIDQNKLDHEEETGDGLPYPGRTLIANNIAFSNGGRAINIFLSQRVDVVNNTTYRNLQTEDLHGIGAEISTFDSDDIRIGNNLIVPLSGKDGISAKGRDLRRQSNIIANGKTNASGQDLLVVDAGFVNPSLDPDAADFRLRISSPAIDAAIGWLATDAEGRPRGQLPDVGAYESTVGGAGDVNASPTTAVPEKQQPDE